MAEKKINSRIVHKHDTEANWLKATNFIPKQAELIVYDIDASYTYERFKIGDGVTAVNNLPFVMDSHIGDNTIHITSDERDSWNEKMDKVTGGKSGNFIKLDANGNAVDSGYSAASFTPIASLTGIIIPHTNNNNIHLPDASTASNGAFLRVVDGAWVAAVLPIAEDGEF